MSQLSRRRRTEIVRARVFAGVVALLTSAADVLRRRRRTVSDVEFTEEWHLWDDDYDGRLASAGVRRRPPDGSGSASAAVAEPKPEERHVTFADAD